MIQDLLMERAGMKFFFSLRCFFVVSPLESCISALHLFGFTTWVGSMDEIDGKPAHSRCMLTRNLDTKNCDSRWFFDRVSQSVARGRSARIEQICVTRLPSTDPLRKIIQKMVQESLTSLALGPRGPS